MMTKIMLAIRSRLFGSRILFKKTLKQVQGDGKVFPEQISATSGVFTAFLTLMMTPMVTKIMLVILSRLFRSRILLKKTLKQVQGDG